MVVGRRVVEHKDDPFSEAQWLERVFLKGGESSTSTGLSLSASLFILLLSKWVGKCCLLALKWLHC